MPQDHLLALARYSKAHLDPPGAAQFDTQYPTQQIRLVTSPDTPRKRTTKTPEPETSLTYLRIVESVTGSGVTQQQLAAAVGASVRSVQTWAHGDAVPSGARAQRLLDVKHLVTELQEVYTDEGVQIWLNSRNRNLDHRRPIDLLAVGQIDTVLDEVQRMVGGMG